MTGGTNSPGRRSAITVAELGAVLLATSVVAALGYSAHKTYTVRQQVAEGVVLANELIPSVTEFFRRHGEVPAELEPSPASLASPFVDSLAVADGRIDVMYGGQADSSIAGRSISLTPYETAHGQIVWICGNETPGVGLQPLGFAGGGRQAARLTTTVERRYLPEPCR